MNVTSINTEIEKPMSWPDSKSGKQPEKKVLFVIDTLQLGGAEQSLLENTSRFKNILPVVCHIYQGDTLKNRFDHQNITVHSLEVRKKYGFVEAYKKLKKVVDVEKPDLIVAYLTRSEIVSRLIAWRLKIPIAGTFVVDLYSPTYNKALSWKAKRVVALFKLINKITSKLCCGFIANSTAIKLSYSKHLGIPLHKITVIHRGRSSHKFRRKERPQRGASDPEIRFLNVSRLFPVKGQADLIRGFSVFLKSYPNSTLTLVGEGPIRQELLQIITDHQIEGKVFLLGARKDIPELLQDNDCFVFPSLVEGFSGAIVEAMFSGIPILASDIPQNQEAIEHMQTGFLFKAASAESITEAMIWYAQNRSLADDLAERAYQYAVENFELDKVVCKFENLLIEMISTRDNKYAATNLHNLH